MLRKEPIIRCIGHLDSSQPHATKDSLTDGEFIEVVKHFLLHPFIVLDFIANKDDSGHKVYDNVWVKEDLVDTLKRAAARVGWGDSIVGTIVSIRTRKIIDHLVSIADIDDISKYDLSDVEEITLLEEVANLDNLEDVIFKLEDDILSR